MRWFAWLIVATLVMAAPLSMGTTSAVEPLYVPRGPIIIDDYLDLSIGGMPNIANGVIAGDGSASNPYLISGWWFKFGDVRKAPLTAIFISNIAGVHIKIENNRFDNVGRVLEIYESHNIIVDGNIGNDTGFGVIIYTPSTNIQVSNNTFATTNGVTTYGYPSGIRDVKIADNVFTGLRSGDGIELNRGSNILIERNTITGFDQGRGIYCGTCRATIANNEITGNDVGIYLGGFSSALRNVIADNRIGIQSAADTVVHYNNFDNNAEYALRDLLPPSDDDAFRHNWWGHQDGPDGDYWDTPGQEVLDVELEQVFPWLTSPNPAAGP